MFWNVNVSKCNVFTWWESNVCTECSKNKNQFILLTRHSNRSCWRFNYFRLIIWNIYSVYHYITYRKSLYSRIFSPCSRYAPFVAAKLIKVSLAVSLMSHPCVTGNFSPSPSHAAYQTGRTGHAWSICQSLGLQESLCPKTHNHTTHASGRTQRGRALSS